MGKFLSKFKFENAVTQSDLENAEISEIRKIIKTGGPIGLARHINIKKNSWKKEPIKLGIAGKTNTGKSSLIYAILNEKEDNVEFDHVEASEKMPTPRKYFHPIEKQLLFYELPGIGSENWEKCVYVSKTQLWEYDYFFIVFDTVLDDDDLWLAQQLEHMKKPFVLVRSKVDLDIEMGCREDAGRTFQMLKEETFSTIDRFEVLKANVGVCFISSVKNIGEMEKLKNHIILNLKSKKYEAILYSLNVLSKEIMETEYTLLKIRILFETAVVTSFSATSFSGLKVCVNMAILTWELNKYIQELRLCRIEMKPSINNVDHPANWSELERTNWKFVRFFLFQSPKLVAFFALAAFQNKFEILGPIFGTVVTSLLSGTIAYNFLTKMLDTLSHESIISYDHVVSRHIPRNTSIRALLRLPDGCLQ